jgi:hypothetical protein
MEREIFVKLLKMVPGLEKRIMNDPSDEDLLHIADLVAMFTLSR